MKAEAPTALDREAFPVVDAGALVVRPDGDLDAWVATAYALAANDNAPADARLRALKRLTRRGA